MHQKAFGGRALPGLASGPLARMRGGDLLLKSREIGKEDSEGKGVAFQLQQFSIYTPADDPSRLIKNAA